MKAFIKTVSLTLCISVTMLFFSSYKKVEAAAAVPLIEGGLYLIAAMLTATAACLSAEVIIEINEFVESNYFADSFSKDSEGLFTYHSLSDSQQMDAVVDVVVAKYNSKVKSGEISSGDSVSVSSKTFSDIVSDCTKELLGAGAAAGITQGITTANGKPQKVTTTYAEETIEVFDYLQLDYTPLNSIFDMKVSIDLDSKTEMNMTKTDTILPYIIKDGSLYVPSYNGDCSYIYYTSSTVMGSGIGFRNYLTSYLGTRYLSIRFAKVDNHLSVATFGCSRYETNGKIQCTRKQSIYSYPQSSSYPVLFDTPSYYNVGQINTNFENYNLGTTISFVNAANTSEILTETDILNSSYDSCGYFESTNGYGFSFIGSIGTAAKMLSGTENAVQGGTKTTYSDLSDIEKAIYTLAKQQGISYEEMLKQCNIMINENGEMYLETLDGVTQSIDNLLAEFEKLLEQGNISNEQGAATVEQLTALLTYLKSLNIEGTAEYIAKIEATLDSLNQGAEDREVLLGDVLGQLQGLNDYLNSLGSISEDISLIRSAVQEAQKEAEEEKKRVEEELKKEKEFINVFIPLVEAGVSSYKLYDQCKYLIDNVFNYDDILEPPNFSFYWDSNGDGEKEIYNPFNLSFLETKLTGENMVDKSWFPVEIKVIDVIRYVIAIIIYGLFVMRLIKRLPTFYGSAFLTHL